MTLEWRPPHLTGEQADFPLHKHALVWLPDGRAGRITVYDPARNHLEVGPLPWYTRAIRRLLGKPNRRAPMTVSGLIGHTLPSGKEPDAAPPHDPPR